MAFYCAEVKVPAFTKGKKQLVGMDVESTRRTVAIRIHVERVIGLLRNKYKILQNILPLGFLRKMIQNIQLLINCYRMCSFN